MFGCAEERAGAGTAAIYMDAGEGPAIAAALVLILISEVYREAAAADRAARNFRQASF